MATFPASFRSDSAAIQGDHQRLLSALADLVAALESLAPNALSLDPWGAARLRRSLAGLLTALPGHFRREETALLDTVAPVSPELAEFARQMRAEHRRFTARLNGFAAGLAALEAGNGAGRTFLSVKEDGEGLARDLAAHIALEEKQLDGFL